MKKSAGLFVLGMFAANFAAAQTEINGYKFINMADSLKGKKLVQSDEPCGCSSGLVNLNSKEVYFSDEATLEKFSTNEKFLNELKNASPEKMEEDMVLEKENYLPQNGVPMPRMLMRVTILGNGTGQIDTGFYRSDMMFETPKPKSQEIQKLPEPLFF